MAGPAHQVSPITSRPSCGWRAMPTLPPRRAGSWISKPRSPAPMRTREESEDFAKGAKVWTRAGAGEDAPGIDWAGAAGRGAAGTARRVPGLSFRRNSEAGCALSFRAARCVEDCWRSTTLNQQANVLPKAFRDASFAFNGTALTRRAQGAPPRPAGDERGRQRPRGCGRQKRTPTSTSRPLPRPSPEDGR
jgi:hypothetical protein